MTTPIDSQRILGASGLGVPALGIGTNKWGSSRGKSNAEIFRTFQAYLDSGMAFFDTAEVYGGGNSERVLGNCMRKDTRPVFIASKFAPFPTRLSSHALMDSLDASLGRLGLEQIDLYMIHWPYTLLRIDALMDMLALAVRIGKVRAVGVSNYDARQMRRAAARLARYNVPLAANEVHYSLFHRLPETNGVLETCQELNVALIAYRPLESGLLQGQADQPALPALSGQRTSLLPLPGQRTRQEQSAKLRETLQTIASRHNRTISQVALNWLLCKDELVIPIPGSTSVTHVLENLGTLSWKLSDEEFTEIDQASDLWRKRAEREPIV
ncbi:MAG TPA: aldo/keto reductase [Ktedonobacteraceae bacterium]|nr:aldo/keto reductase [Ktedonobacteraceae bacterium]